MESCLGTVSLTTTFGRSHGPQWTHSVVTWFQERKTNGELLERLKQEKVELEGIAVEFIESSLLSTRSRYNADKSALIIEKCYKVMLRRNQTEDILSPRFDGLFDMLYERVSNVKLRLRRRDK